MLIDACIPLRSFHQDGRFQYMFLFSRSLEAGTKTVRSLDFSGNASLSDLSLGPLSGIDTLEALRLGKCEGISDAGIARFLGASAAASYGKVLGALGDMRLMISEAKAEGDVVQSEIDGGLAGPVARAVAHSSLRGSDDRIPGHALSNLLALP